MREAKATWWFRARLDEYRGHLLGRVGGAVSTANTDLREPHRMHLFRQQVKELLDLQRTHASSRHQDPTVVADLLSLVWGVDGHPCSPSEARRLLRLDISLSTIEKWPEQVLESFPVRRRIQELADRAVDDGLDSQRTTQSDHSSLRRSVLAALKDGGALNPYRPRLEAAYDEEVATSVLRDVTAERVERWYFSGEEPCLAHLRHFRLTVARSWFSDDVLEGTGVLPEVAGRGVKTRYRRAVNAAVPMLMCAAAEDRSALRRAAARRSELGRRFLVELPAMRRSSKVHAAAPETPGAQAAALVTAGSATTEFLTNDSAAGPNVLAAAIREATLTDPRLATGWIGHYLIERHRFRSMSTTETKQLELALADQSVHWDCVLLDQDTLARRLATDARREPAVPGIAYLPLTWRCIAVLENKAGRWAQSFWEITSGMQALRRMNSDGLIPDGRQCDAAQHQLVLAAAGVSLRMLETRLAGSARTSDRFALGELARTALECSRAAMGLLVRLEASGLPPWRGEDGQIASSSWRVQSRIVRIRVLLTVLTALESGMLSRGDLLSRPAAHLPLSALASFAASVDDVTDCDVAVIADLYRQLLRLPELEARHAVPMVRLAAWLAFLDGGRVPVEEVAGPVVLEAPALLDSDPDTCAQGVADHVLDVRELAAWLALRSADAGVLSWLPRHQAVARTLDRRSGLFEAFRHLHDVYRPPHPLPD